MSIQKTATRAYLRAAALARDVRVAATDGPPLSQAGQERLRAMMPGYLGLFALGSMVAAVSFPMGGEGLFFGFSALVMAFLGGMVLSMNATQRETEDLRVILSETLREAECRRGSGMDTRLDCPGQLR